jgi:quinol monooxygenase YgiN
MTVPYTVIGTVVAKPETREELQKILSGFVEPTRAEDGCINYDFHVDSADPCVFMFYENWRSKGDLDRHLAMPHLKPLFGRLDDLVARPVDVRRFVMLSQMAR